MLDIVIDPGHGGVRPAGRSSPYGCPSGGRPEKDLTLALARSVQAALPGSRLTRRQDHNLSLSTRRSRARECDVLVSLHGAVPGNPATVWIHPRGGRPAHALGTHLARAVGARTVRADTDMAVLRPEGLRLGCAACLVEADFDRLDGNGIADTGGAIASAIRGYGTTYGDGYFTDTDELVAYMRDQRGADTRRVSSVASAEAAVDDWVSRGRPNVWRHLDASRVGDEIRDRCQDYRLFRQGNLNLCGPASFLSMWAGRDPLGYARYAIGLMESGEGRIGRRRIRASQDLRNLRYPRLGSPRNMSTPQADFLAMAPLRNDANAILPYDGSSSTEALAGLTTPGELADWMRATGVWSTVRQEANWARNRGYDHAVGLMPGGGADIALLIHVNALAAARNVTDLVSAGSSNPFTPDHTFILSQFPNHFVILLSEIVPDVQQRTLSLSVWTWAGSYVFEGVPLRSFMSGYYGAVRGTTRR